MITTLLSIAAVALCFVTFALLRPRPRCGSQCGLCRTPCHPIDREATNE